MGKIAYLIIVLLISGCSLFEFDERPPLINNRPFSDFEPAPTNAPMTNEWGEIIIYEC